MIIQIDEPYCGQRDTHSGFIYFLLHNLTTRSINIEHASTANPMLTMQKTSFSIIFFLNMLASSFDRKYHKT